METIDRLTNETVELLQALIRNQCVNDGTPDSGHEVRNAELLRDGLELDGVDQQLFETLPGRTSLIARYPGSDPDAPAICLMGHTDVVPVTPEGWDNDPFAGELIDGEVWGRGAVDMLNLTSSMAVAFREVARSGKRYPGDIVYFAVADEEQGGLYGASELVGNEWDALQCDFVLTEYGGTPNPDGTTVLLTNSEKGGAGRRITVHGEPGHGSMPYRANSALIKAAEVVRRLAEYNPEPRLDQMWTDRIGALGLPDETERQLLDPARLYDALAELPAGLARNLHSCAHMSFSPNILRAGDKSNTIPDVAELVVDIRILPGETPDDAEEHLRIALGDELMASIQMEPTFANPEQYAMAPSSSPTDTKLWEALTDSIRLAYPAARVVPSMVTGGTDARYFRQRGVHAYGAGLLSPEVSLSEFNDRFHGNNERIDVESLRLTTQLWLDILDRLW